MFRRKPKPATLPDFETMKAMIDAASVVSFDFFDTLVARVVEEPWHAFLLVEKAVAERMGKPRPFVTYRCQAEHIARQRGWRKEAKVEVSLDEIYDVMLALGFSREECAIYKAEEIAVEKLVIYPDPINKKLYEYALEREKPIIVLSDMYLPQKAFEEIAINCGYTRHRTFLSNTWAEGKSSEGMFAIVLDLLRKERSIKNSSEIVHFGDNHYVDVFLAGRWGIKTVFRPSSHSKFRNSGLGKWELLKALLPNDHDPLERTLFLGLFARYWLESGERPFKEITISDLGFYVVGPLLLGFALWLRQSCLKDGIDHLFFLSRDGFIYKRAFDRLKQALDCPIETTYIYTSRRAAYLPSLTQMNGPANVFFVVTFFPMPVKEYFARLDIPIEPFAEEVTQIFGSTDAVVGHLDFRLGYFFRRRVFPNIQEQIVKERELATEYMRQTGMFRKKSAVCDIGYNGSMQEGLTSIARIAGENTSFNGYYLCTFEKTRYGAHHITGWLFDAHKPRERHKSFTQAIDLMELFFAGPHGTVLGYKKENGRIEPVLRPVSEHEASRLEFTKQIHEGAMRFVDMFLDNTQGRLTELSPDICLAPWNSFVTEPPREILNMFLNIQHNGGVGSSSYIPLVLEVPTWKEIVKRPMCLSEGFKRSLWRQGFRASLSPMKRRILDYLLKIRP